MTDIEFIIQKNCPESDSSHTVPTPTQQRLNNVYKAISPTHHANLVVSWSFPRTFVAVLPGPALQTGLVAAVVAGEVAEEVVARPAELVASEAVVVLAAGDADLVLELGCVALVRQLLPWVVGVDHARVKMLLDDLSRGACRKHATGQTPHDK